MSSWQPVLCVPGAKLLIVLPLVFSDLCPSPDAWSHIAATSSLTSGYHQQCYGQIERASQDLETALRCVTALHPTSWSSSVFFQIICHEDL